MTSRPLPHVDDAASSPRLPRARAWGRRLRIRTRAVRARVRRTPAGRLGWRIGVGVVGTVLLLAGIVMIPGPGQGWAVVFLSLALLSTEFRWAHRVREALWHRAVQAREGYSAASPRRRALAAALAAVVVVGSLAAALWASLALTGLPGWLPGWLDDRLARLPGLG